MRRGNYPAAGPVCVSKASRGNREPSRLRLREQTGSLESTETGRARGEQGGQGRCYPDWERSPAGVCGAVPSSRTLGMAEMGRLEARPPHSQPLPRPRRLAAAVTQRVCSQRGRSCAAGGMVMVSPTASRGRRSCARRTSGLWNHLHRRLQPTHQAHPAPATCTSDFLEGAADRFAL